MQYQSCLTNITDDWRSRWNALRQLVNAWHGTSLRDCENGQTIADQLGNEFPLAEKYPDSMLQWIEFKQELIRLNLNYITRECLDVAKVNSPPSISLQEISEGNCCWVVLDSNLAIPDPPVHVLSGACYGDFDPSIAFADRWELSHENAATLSEFALSQVFHMLRGDAGGCGVWIEEDLENFKQEMKQEFDRTSVFGQSLIFESADMIATLKASRLLFEAKGAIGKSDLPSCVARNLDHGGSFHGCLVP